MLLMRLCCSFHDASDALMMLMRWFCWCADAADALMLLMHWCYWCADAVDVLMLADLWSGLILLTSAMLLWLYKVRGEGEGFLKKLCINCFSFHVSCHNCNPKLLQHQLNDPAEWQCKLKWNMFSDSFISMGWTGCWTSRRRWLASWTMRWWSRWEMWCMRAGGISMQLGATRMC